MSEGGALHEQGYALAVTDDGHRHVYKDVIDFGPMWSDGEITGFRVRTPDHDWLIFEPPPESICLVKQEAV